MAASPTSQNRSETSKHGLALGARCASAFPLVQSENEHLALRFQETETSLQALRSVSIAKEGNLQSALDTAEKDMAALMGKNEQLSAELAATRAESQAVRAGLQVLVHTCLSSAPLPHDNCQAHCLRRAHRRCHQPSLANFPFRAMLTRHRVCSP